MNRGVYSLANGMIANQQWLEVTANNLANVSTSGFKQDGLLFNDILERRLNADGGKGALIGSLGSGGEAKAEYTNLDQGQVNTTGNALDFAVEGQGMFAIQMPNGQIRFTRDGAFTLDANKQLVTKLGQPVLNDQLKPITIPDGTIKVDADGTMSVSGQPGFDRLGLFAGKFSKEGSNLFSSAGTPTLVETTGDGASRVKQEALEGSNVSPTSAMVDMVTNRSGDRTRPKSHSISR